MTFSNIFNGRSGGSWVIEAVPVGFPRSEGTGQHDPSVIAARMAREIAWVTEVARTVQADTGEPCSVHLVTQFRFHL